MRWRPFLELKGGKVMKLFANSIKDVLVLFENWSIFLVNSKVPQLVVGRRDQVVDVIVTWTQKHATELDKDRCYASLMVASPLKFPAPQGKFELWRGCFRRRIQWKTTHTRVFFTFSRLWWQHLDPNWRQTMTCALGLAFLSCELGSKLMVGVFELKVKR